MSGTFEDRRERLKRWYLDNGKTMIDFANDCIQTRKMHGCEWATDAIEQMYQEHVALGNIKVQSSVEDKQNG